MGKDHNPYEYWGFILKQNSEIQGKINRKLKEYIMKKEKKNVEI